jgi:hypothetical protein
VGLPRPTFRNLYINPLFDGDTTLAGQLLERANRGRRDPFVQFRTSGTRYSLTDRGVVTEELPVHTYRAAAPAGKS